MKHTESKLQIACVRWFRLQYPNIILFAIPNGGQRGIIGATILKREGVLAGVPDLFLAKQVNSFGGLFIEMKSAKGVQSASQREIMVKLLSAGYQYQICRDFDSFRNAVTNYINQ